MNREAGKMPRWIKLYCYFYIIGFPIIQSIYAPIEVNVFVVVLSLAISSAIFSYGVISLTLDFKNGGLTYIIKRIKDFKDL